MQKVLWLLGELGLPFEHEQVGGAHGGLDDPEFLRMNPHGRVPVLRDGDTIVWESHSILRYLAARYGSEALWPADPGARSRVDRWMDWSLASLQPAFMRLFWGYFRTPPDLWDRAGLQPAIEECDRFFALLDGELAGRAYLAGSAFSLADIPAGTALYRYFGMGLAVPRHPQRRRVVRAALRAQGIPAKRSWSRSRSCAGGWITRSAFVCGFFSAVLASWRFIRGCIATHPGASILRQEVSP